jgi:adenine-specific DNA methylase
MPHKPFIEVQFPLARLSAESYKERKAGSGQTLTGLGKWWGRKPLILVRAVLLGLLMPASEDPEKDREIFYKILTMDEDGLWRRKTKPLSASDIAERLSPEEYSGLIDTSAKKPSWKKGVSKEEKIRLEKIAFARLPYEDKLAKCCRPEEIDGPAPEAWKAINAHLGTQAKNLEELFMELSEKAFGHRARVGDCFCGGGSVPFEAARLGLEAYGSDLNPVATLLSWGAINLVGGGKELQEEIRRVQEEVWRKVDAQITDWGIEHDGAGNRADAYLYCVEVKCPATGLWVPLAPSWVISEKYRVVAKLRRNDQRFGYDIDIVTGANDRELAEARKGTVQNSELVDPEDPSRRYSIASLRGDRRGENGETIYGLRLWEKDDLVPRPDDVFQERLYCVRWVSPTGERIYKSVTAEDLEREAKVLALLKERFTRWQERGYIPSMKITPGYNTEQPIRERGWTYWHHLFNPRQLLIYGLISNFSDSLSKTDFIAIKFKLGILLNWSSRLCIWNKDASKGPGSTEQTFANQALNTQFNYGCRGSLFQINSFFEPFKLTSLIKNSTIIIPLDARDVSYTADLWVTDPPYADAVNYHELADFFLAWYEKHLPRLFPEWYANSRAALAVRGADEDFKRSMVEIYRNLAAHMPDNGLQLVMFTHQDAGVWADLGMILWAAGLRVTAAWTIGTETSSGLKKGNYVQGTVLLVLRKRTNTRRVWLDELYPEVEDEVRRQLDTMQTIDDTLAPQFGDTDYQLAAYAAALRVLTAYSQIEDMNIEHELFRLRGKNEESQFEKIIDRAVRIATNYRIPRGISNYTWRNLEAIERLYLSGLELERHGECRQGAYQELARGFGVDEYRFLLGDTDANMARFKTATEFKRTILSMQSGSRDSGQAAFATSLTRHILFAIFEAVRTENPREGLNYLKAELTDYWGRRDDSINLLEYLAAAGAISGLSHWHRDAEAASLLAGLIRNDYVGSR